MKTTEPSLGQQSKTGEAAAHASQVVPGGLRVSFKNSRGTRLIARLVAPAGNERWPVVVFAHGWDSGKHSPHGRLIALRLADHGIASFLVDFTGHGESEGRPDDCTVTQQTHDLAAAVDILTTLDEVDSHRVGMMGLSSGAACALAIAARDSRVRALVLCSASLAGVADAPARVTTPTLLVLGEADAPIHALNERLMETLDGPRRLETIPSDLFEDPGALIRASDVMAEWFQRHLA